MRKPSRRVRSVLDRIAGRVFELGPRAGDASTFKIVNNLLAGANLAAGAEALALAQAAGLDLERVRDVVNASSGGSWIFADRIARALAGDLAPRAAVTLLAKDVGIAATLAERLDVDAPFTRLASKAFAAAVGGGSWRRRRRRADAPRRSTPRGDAATVAASRATVGAPAARYFGRAFMSTSTYCQTCPRIGCGT